MPQRGSLVINHEWREVADTAVTFVPRIRAAVTAGNLIRLTQRSPALDP
ncbi:MAG: hypothetical protein QOJ71_2668 [Actinomycetota bacterium]|nr:hypothetical protein [Actinomycetota bacterium]